MGMRAWLAAPISPFQPPSAAYRLVHSPVHTILSLVHRALVFLRGPVIEPEHPPIRVVCISDTHTNTPSLPAGDLLIHAGDLTNAGTVSEIQSQLDWLDAQPFEHVVAIAGNHDSYFDPRSRVPSDRGKALDFKTVKYLQHSRLTLKFPKHDDRKLVLYGAPQIPACGGDEMAFQYARGDDAWSGTVPDDVDILVTHTPPKWHLDLPVGLGCEFLLGELWRVRPRLHVFGHVHGGRGRESVQWDRAQKAYERIAGRQRWLDMLRIGFWLDVARVLVYGAVGIVWARVWGADAEGSILVNSALVDWKNNLLFDGRVIEI